MRTTIEIPDALFRRTKALAAMRGTTLKDLVVRAVEHEVSAARLGDETTASRQVKLPLLHLRQRRKLDLSGVDFDDLLA